MTWAWRLAAGDVWMLDLEYVFDIIRFLAEWVRECHDENIHGTLALSALQL